MVSECVFLSAKWKYSEKVSLSNIENHIKIIVCKMRFLVWQRVVCVSTVAVIPFLNHYIDLFFHVFFSLSCECFNSFRANRVYFEREFAKWDKHSVTALSLFDVCVSVSCVSAMVFGCQRLNCNLNETRVDGVLPCVRCTLLSFRIFCRSFFWT